MNVPRYAKPRGAAFFFFFTQSTNLIARNTIPPIVCEIDRSPGRYISRYVLHDALLSINHENQLLHSCLSSIEKKTIRLVRSILSSRVIFSMEFVGMQINGI